MDSSGEIEEADNLNVVREILGEQNPDLSLSCEKLQENAKNPEKIRNPTAISILAGQSMVILGFDSGEVQVYEGFPESVHVGAGFRVSESEPVVFLKSVEDWNPFHPEDGRKEFRDGRKSSVRLFNYYYHRLH